MSMLSNLNQRNESLISASESKITKILTKSLRMLEMQSFAFGSGVEVGGDGRCIYLNPKWQRHYMKALGGTNSLSFPTI